MRSPGANLGLITRPCLERLRTGVGAALYTETDEFLLAVRRTVTFLRSDLRFTGVGVLIGEGERLVVVGVSGVDGEFNGDKLAILAGDSIF